MKKLSGTALLLEKLFWAFLFINPFLDIINGIYINAVMHVDMLDVKFTNTLGVTPSLVVRMLMLLVFAAYVLIVKDKKSILAAVPIALAWLLSMVSEYFTLHSVQLFVDTQYAARFCYNIVLLMVYTRVFSDRWGDDGAELLKKLNLVIAFTLIVLSVSILASAIIGIGYSTYADRLGYRGSRGFFYAGNDITAVLSLLLPINIANLMVMDRRRAGTGRCILFALASGLSANALVIIGSKTAFISVAVAFVLMLILGIFVLVKSKDKRAFLGYLWSLASALIVFAILMLCSGMELLYSIISSYSVTGEIASTEGMENAILSGRQFKLSDHLSQFKAGGPITWLFGLGRGSQTEILEMDVFEVFFYYGIFGAAAFLWLYVKVAIEFFKGLFRRPGIIGIALFAALGMCAGYLIIAGHILFSVTSGFYFIFVIIYSRAFFARSREDVLLWKSTSLKADAK